MTHSFDKNYWDDVWQGDRAPAMAVAEPNPHLVRGVAGLAPGTALEAGCGAGAEAIWLGAQGWQVTAADISADALARASAQAVGSDVADRVRWVEADLSTWEPDQRYDLVTTHYAHPAMPQLEFYDRLASWVAPGGTLFIVGHLHPDQHGSVTGHGHEHGPEYGRGQPPVSASATADGVVGRLDPAEWRIDTAREAHRAVTGPDGRDVSLHDVILKAVRRN